MMISPLSYVETELKGKTRDEALKAVKELLDEIKDLKKEIEEDSLSDEIMIHPSPSLQLSMSYDYLEAAREYFKSQGWEYDPEPFEVSDEEFNGKLNEIKSIEFNIGGYFGGSESRIVTFDGDKVLDEHIIRDRFQMLEKQESDLTRYTKKEFLELLTDIHMGRWKKDYDNPNVLDGTGWDVTVEYNNGDKWESSGSNAYPYNFWNLLEAMEMSSMDRFEEV